MVVIPGSLTRVSWANAGGCRLVADPRPLPIKCEHDTSPIPLRPCSGRAGRLNVSRRVVVVVHVS